MLTNYVNYSKRLTWGAHTPRQKGGLAEAFWPGLKSSLQPAWPRPHSPAALAGGGQDVVAGTEGPGPGLHAGALQQVLGFLMLGAPWHGLRLGSKGPAGWRNGQSGRGGIRRKMTRIRRALTVSSTDMPGKKPA